VLQSSSSMKKSSSQHQWRTHIFDDDRDLSVNFKWRLCFAVMRTLSSATGLMVGMIPAAFILEESKTNYFAMQESFEHHDISTFWNLCFGTSSDAAWLMTFMWLTLLAISLFNAMLSRNGLDSSEGSSEDTVTDEDEEDEDEEDEDEEMNEELIPLVPKHDKKNNLLPIFKTRKKRVDSKTENLVFGMPRPMLLFFAVALWLEILREIVLIVSPMICVGILSWTLSGTAWFLQISGVVMLLSYLLIGWLSGRFVTRFGVQNACTSTFALVVFMVSIDVTLFDFVYETRRNPHAFIHYTIFAILILALATIASVSNMFAICNKLYNQRHRPSKWVKQSTLRLIGEVLAGVCVASLIWRPCKEHGTHLETASSNVFSFLVVGQTALTMTAAALLNFY